METRIQTGETEQIEVLMLDGALSPLTGLSDVLLSIRRVSDGYWYDFDDSTFKNTGWTTRQQVMTEVDATNDSGVYSESFDTSVITNPTADDTYELRVDCVSAVNVPQVGEIKVGQFVDDITFLKDIEGGRWKIEGVQMIFYKSDNLTEVARFNLFDAAGNPTSAVEVFERKRV